MAGKALSPRDPHALGAETQVDAVKIQASTVPVLQPGASSTLLDGECVVLDASGAVIRGLNPTGARIWTLTDGVRTAEAIAKIVSQEWDVRLEQAVTDVLAFLNELSMRGLIQASGGSR
jgi:hypothetical protein